MAYLILGHPVDKCQPHEMTVSNKTMRQIQQHVFCC